MYNIDGSIAEKGYYIKGKMEGFWTRFDENGTLRETENYLKGNKNGDRNSQYKISVNLKHLSKTFDI